MQENNLDVKNIALTASAVASGNAYLSMLSKVRAKQQRRGIIENIRLNLKNLNEIGSEAIIKNGRIIVVRSDEEKEYVEIIKNKIETLKRLKNFNQDETDTQLVNISETHILEIELFLLKQGFIVEGDILVGWSKLEETQ